MEGKIVLMISAWSSKALWIFNWALIWPAWCGVAIAWRQSNSKVEPARLLDKLR